MSLYHPRRYIAECAGTALLTLLVSLASLKSLGVPTPVIAGMVLGIVVYILGPVSGAQINPAVTLGLWSVRKINGREAVLYILSQLCGAVIAMVLAFLVTGMIPNLQPQDAWQTGLAEAIGAAILVCGVSAVVAGKVKAEASGIVIGASLLLGALLASSAGNGVINPAVALGAGSLSLTYVLAPLVGGIAGAWGYRWVAA